MPLPHFTKSKVCNELWIDYDMNFRHLRLIKISKILYKIEHGSCEGFVVNRKIIWNSKYGKS